MKIETGYLPNLGIVQSKLDSNIIEKLWNLVEKAKKDNINIKESLAGNITSSLMLDLKESSFLNASIVDLLDEYKKNLGTPFKGLRAVEVNTKFNLDSLWVNFQYQNEFNPSHNHSGGFSFVIWLKIPTEFEQQSKLKIARESSDKTKISNFVLIYTDILGQIRECVYKMGSDKEGVILFFPASLKHQVYPFYGSDAVRVSVSGNIGVIQEDLK
jgi:hypothetical protein|tara:strand:- start:48 stop:689 length:642 start_codon:yes stop_codon:yes gene_type:complete